MILFVLHQYTLRSTKLKMKRKTMAKKIKPSVLRFEKWKKKLIFGMKFEVSICKKKIHEDITVFTYFIINFL